MSKLFLVSLNEAILEGLRGSQIERSNGDSGNYCFEVLHCLGQMLACFERRRRGNKRHPTIVTHPTACHRTQKVRSAFKITVKNLYKNNYFIVLMSFKGYYLSGLIFLG